MKQLIAHGLRSTGLFDLADRLRYQIHRLRMATANKNFTKTNPGLTTPPDELLYEISSSVDHGWYFRTGEQLARTFSDLVDKHLPERTLSVGEWGCGVGRIIRHMRPINPRIERCIGMDYDPRMVAWCSQHIPGVEFVRNHLMPPTTIRDGYFDAVYCFSVLTHLSESAHHAWVAEMRRMIRPGGLFLFTTMGDSCAVNLLPAERARYDAGELVTRSAKEGARGFVAYESEQFVRKKLLPGHQILDHIRPAPGKVAQDFWVMRM